MRAWLKNNMYINLIELFKLIKTQSKSFRENHCHEWKMFKFNVHLTIVMPRD